MASELRPIPGFPNYLAASDGSIWTLKRKGGNDRGAGRVGPPRKLKLNVRRNGYCSVSLDVAGRVVTCQVQRLVLLAFVGPPPTPQHHACHYPDTTPSNNSVENLRWDTASENAKDKFRHLYGAPEKLCRRCGVTHQRTAFYADKRNVDGRQSECKTCHNRQAVATRDPAKKNRLNREFMRRMRASNPSYGR